METTTYLTTVTDNGEWLHSAGSDFLFAFVDASLPDDVKLSIRTAYTQALQLPSKIKAEVKATSGRDVVNGLYLLDQTAMTEAMNNIVGMAETSVDNQWKSGTDVSVGINAEFFSAVLAGMGGDVAPIMKYLTEEMGVLQAEVRTANVTQNFGTIMGTVSVEPVVGVPVTFFKYVYSDEETSDWFVSVPCGSAEKHSYDYSFTVVDYLYVPEAQA